MCLPILSVTHFRFPSLLMKINKDIVSVSAIHIEAGIAKYGGVLDTNLADIIKYAGLQYTPYLFNDGRILLVLPKNVSAFLYKDKETLFQALSLES